jgi:hypothetical protein
MEEWKECVIDVDAFDISSDVSCDDLLIFQLLPIVTVHSEIVNFVTTPLSTYGSLATKYLAASFVVNTNSACI